MLDRLRGWLTAHPARTVAWGWIIALVLITLAGIAVVRSAHAATATLDWTNATQREDGTALAPGELRETQIDYAKCTAGTNTFPPTADGTKVFPFPAITGTIPNLAYGKWCFRARHIDSTGLASLDSGTVWANYLAPPKPPTLLTVKSLVWDYRLKNGAEELRVVGTIEAGKKCSGLAPVTGFDLFDVNRADVKLNKPISRNRRLIAQCAIT